jgi:hypothetical protein
MVSASGYLHQFCNETSPQVPVYTQYGGDFKYAHAYTYAVVSAGNSYVLSGDGGPIPTEHVDVPSSIGTAIVGIYNGSIVYTTSGSKWSRTGLAATWVKCVRTICISDSGLYSLDGKLWAEHGISGDVRVMDYKLPALFVGTRMQVLGGMNYTHPFIASIVQCNDLECFAVVGGSLYVSSNMLAWELLLGL